MNQVQGGALSLSLRPLTSRIGYRLFKRDLERLATETIELAPANRRYRPSAIALPDEPERIKFFHGWTPSREIIRQDALAHLSEGEDLHPSTVAIRIKDALVADGCVYGHTSLEVITKERRRALLSGKIERIREAQLCTTHCGSIYFGDWLMVDIPLELLATQRGTTPLSVSNVTFGHEAGYRERFGFPRVMRPQSIVHAESLWIVRENDRGMTRNRLDRYAILRERVRKPNSSGSRRIFIDRGSWGEARGIRNRGEVLKSLETRGFNHIYPETMTVDEISATLSSAEICVGVEGSAMCHASMLMPAGSCTLAVVPENRFLTYLKWFTDAFDSRYAYVIGQRPTAGATDVWVDVRRLNATLDLVERAL